MASVTKSKSYSKWRNVYTLDEAKAYLHQALEARTKALAAQAYNMGTRSVTRAMLDAIDRDIDKWSEIVDDLTPGDCGMKAVFKTWVPRWP